MQHEIHDSPDFALLQISFDEAGEKIVAESGAMVAMDSSIKMETSMRGGLMAAAKRKLLGGESLFQNTYTATEAGQKLYLAPPAEGDLRALTLKEGETFYLQSGAYVAHVGESLKIDTKMEGFKGFFGGAGFFMLKITGPGVVYYGCYGAIHQVEIGSAGYTIDNDHLIGFSDGLNYKVRKFGGIKSFFFSGEALVCDFDGQGQLFLQTRNSSSLAAFLEPYRPTKSK